MSERSWTLHVPVSASTNASPLPGVPLAALFLTTGASALAGALYSTPLANATRLEQSDNSLRNLSFSVSPFPQTFEPARVTGTLSGELATSRAYTAPAVRPLDGREARALPPITQTSPAELFRPRAVPAAAVQVTVQPQRQARDLDLGTVADVDRALAITRNDKLPGEHSRTEVNASWAPAAASDQTIGQLANAILARGDVGFLQGMADPVADAQFASNGAPGSPGPDTAIKIADETVASFTAGESLPRAHRRDAALESPDALAASAPTVEQLVTGILAGGKAGFLQEAGAPSETAATSLSAHTSPGESESPAAEAAAFSAPQGADLALASEAAPPVSERGPEIGAARAIAATDAASPAIGQARSSPSRSPSETARSSEAHPTEFATGRFKETPQGTEFFIETRVNRSVAGSVALLIDVKKGPDDTWQASSFSIRLGDILDLVRTQMSSSLYERLSRSASTDQFVTFEQLREAGIELRFNNRDQLEITAA
jgi:hypothetical protein